MPQYVKSFEREKNIGVQCKNFHPGMTFLNYKGKHARIQRLSYSCVFPLKIIENGDLFLSKLLNIYFYSINSTDFSR